MSAGPVRGKVRSPVDVLRLLVGLALVGVGLAAANLFDSAALGLSRDGADVMDDLPGWAADLPGAALAVTLMAIVSVGLLASLITTRYRRALMMVAAVFASGAMSLVLGDIAYSFVDADVQRAFDDATAPYRFPASGGGVEAGDPLLAAAVAMIGVASSFVRRAAVRLVVLAVTAYASVSLMSAGVPAIGMLTDVGAGVIAASVTLLAFGRHDLALRSSEIADALSTIGVTPARLERTGGDVGGFVPWAGAAADGTPISVKAFGRDQRSADLLARARRWVRFRSTGNQRPFASLRRDVEHEALVSFQVAALGVSTPRLLGVAAAGIDGMVLAYEGVEGVPADTVADLGDDVLTSVWSHVRTLHQRRVAHRNLRLGNVVLGRDGEPRLTGFGDAELAASEPMLAVDIAELLASTAALVGPERAVAAATEVLGFEQVASSLPWLQPLALTTPTRAALGASDLDLVRQTVAERCGSQPEELVQLERVKASTLFLIVTIGLSAYFLVPQLADIDNIWQQVRSASLIWVLVAGGFSALSYIAATTSLLGAIPVRLRFLPALGAQIAASFANRITPAKVGGYALNVRYFQRQGVPAAVSLTGVGVNAVAGVIVHVVLTLGFLVLASGSGSAQGLSVPSAGVVLVSLGVLVGVGVVSSALPFVRRLFVTHVLPQLRTGWESIRTLGRQPLRLVMLLGGAATITLSYLGAMVASLEAFGSSASFPLVALLFLTGTAVANAAPTPGGLGATEAALIAGLSTVEETAVVIPAVFLFRFVTFWLPILPGWIALVVLRRADRI